MSVSFPVSQMAWAVPSPEVHGGYPATRGGKALKSLVCTVSSTKIKVRQRRDRTIHGLFLLVATLTVHRLSTMSYCCSRLVPVMVPGD